MPNCAICNRILSSRKSKEKDKYELSGDGFICKDCAQKIGVTNFFSAGLLTPKTARKKYYKLYPEEAPIETKPDPDDEARLDEEFIKQIEAIPNCKVGIPGYLTYIRQTLEDAEKVLYVVTGLMSKDSILEIGSTKYKNAIWLVALTNTRIIMVHKRVPVGVDTISFPLESIKAVSCKTGLADSVITITQGLTCVMLQNIKNVYAKVFEDKANTAIRDILNGGSKQPVQIVAPSTADELVKWNSLLQQGIITQEEFNAQKEKLLK